MYLYNEIVNMDDSVPFLNYYLKFAKKDPYVRKVIEKYDASLVLHSAKSKTKPFLEEYNEIIFNYYYNMKGYFDGYIVAKHSIDPNAKLEMKKKKEVLDKTKGKLNKIIKNLCYKSDKCYHKINIPHLIMDEKHRKKIVSNTTVNICCFVNDRFDDNNKHIFPKKIFSYLPSSIKTVDVRINAYYFVKILNEYYNNLPNKVRVLNNDFYPGVTWRNKIKLPLKTILIINFEKRSYGTSESTENIIGYSSVKSFMTLIRFYKIDINYFLRTFDSKENCDIESNIFVVKKPNKKMISYHEKINKDGITTTIDEID